MSGNPQQWTTGSCPQVVLLSKILKVHRGQDSAAERHKNNYQGLLITVFRVASLSDLATSPLLI